MLKYWPTTIAEHNKEQTKDVRMYIEEFILVDVVTLLYKLELNMHWKML